MDNENKLAPDASTSAGSRQAIFTPTPAAEGSSASVETPATPAPAPTPPPTSATMPAPAPTPTQTQSVGTPDQPAGTSAQPMETPAQSALITPTPGSALGANPQSDSTSDPRHPFFAHHPTQTFNTDTGDIILVHDAPKTSFNKKPFIIGAVVLLAFTIISFVVIAAVAPKGNNSDKGSSVNVAAASQALNKYANYLLYGKESMQALEGDYDRWEIYTLEEKLESEEKDTTYWETVIKLLSEAQNSYQDTVLSKTEDWSEEQYDDAEALGNAMAADLDVLKMLQAYRGTGKVADEIILTNYLAGGVDGVKNYIRNLYAPLANADSTAAQSYFEQILQQYELTAQSLDLYRSYGCIVNRAINETCADSAYEQSNEIQSIEDGIGNLWVRNDLYIESTVQRLESNCWVFSQELAELATKGGK